jgi:hypothetical protein
MTEDSYNMKSRSNSYYVGRFSKKNSLFYSRISIQILHMTPPYNTLKLYILKLNEADMVLLAGYAQK